MASQAKITGHSLPVTWNALHCKQSTTKFPPTSARLPKKTTKAPATFHSFSQICNRDQTKSCPTRTLTTKQWLDIASPIKWANSFLIDALPDHTLTHQAPYLVMAQPTLEAEDTTTQQSPPAASAEWLETFLLHFDNLRETPNVDATFDAVYNEQQTNKPRDASPLHQTTASRELSPVFILPSRESTPVFRVTRSRDGTPVLSTSTSTSRDSTPATYSRESTPVLSLNMDDPVKAGRYCFDLAGSCAVAG